ncbi:MAG TPA: hypothetical protein VK611_05920 [Acidimicrobiales bacterium]|nr:hypothetical protein [Acidimicrobiales bacterium]
MAANTTIEQRQRTAYRRDMVPAITGYAVVLALALSLVGDKVDRVGEWVLLLLPIVPALWGVRAVVRHLRRIDEYQRSLQLEAMAAGFGVAMVTAITLGFVGVGGAATRAAGWIVYGAGMGTWALVALVQGRRR